jgi:hypothetical protein
MTIGQATVCPGCGAPMTAMTLDGHTGRTMTIDACTACRAFWFDGYESLQLAPASTLKLFTLIGGQTTAGRQPMSKTLDCPRCHARLLLAHDRQRDTPFEYWRCDAKHGRFISYFNFLREKSFIRTLSARQLDELRRNVQTVNCSNCGAPIDLTRTSACAHCGSPLSMLDMQQAERLVTQLKEASQPKPIDPALPLELARARREVDQAFATIDGNTDWWRDASASGLVEAGLNAVVRWLRR